MNEISFPSVHAGTPDAPHMSLLSSHRSGSYCPVTSLRGLNSPLLSFIPPRSHSFPCSCTLLRSQKEGRGEKERGNKNQRRESFGKELNARKEKKKKKKEKREIKKKPFERKKNKNSFKIKNKKSFKIKYRKSFKIKNKSKSLNKLKLNKRLDVFLFLA